MAWDMHRTELRTQCKKTKHHTDLPILCFGGRDVKCSSKKETKKEYFEMPIFMWKPLMSFRGNISVQECTLILRVYFFASKIKWKERKKQFGNIKVDTQ